MNWMEVSSIVIAAVAIVGSIVAAQRYNADQRTKIKDGAEAGRGRVYERLDECKGAIVNDIKKEYARKDLCINTHQHVDRELKEIKEKVNLIPEIAAQLKILVNGSKG